MILVYTEFMYHHPELSYHELELNNVTQYIDHGDDKLLTIGNI